MKRTSLYNFSFLLYILLLAGCESIDCTLNNIVSLNVGFYESTTGNSYSITDTLNITANGTDSILYNRGFNISTLTLPMSYWQDADTLNLNFYDSSLNQTNTVVLRIAKSNTPHFESPDCPTTMFHNITAIDFDDTSKYVDSIVITRYSHCHIDVI